MDVGLKVIRKVYIRKVKIVVWYLCVYYLKYINCNGS